MLRFHGAGRIDSCRGMLFVIAILFKVLDQGEFVKIKAFMFCLGIAVCVFCTSSGFANSLPGVPEQINGILFPSQNGLPQVTCGGLIKAEMALQDLMPRLAKTEKSKFEHVLQVLKMTTGHALPCGGDSGFGRG